MMDSKPDICTSTKTKTGNKKETKTYDWNL